MLRVRHTLSDELVNYDKDLILKIRKYFDNKKRKRRQLKIEICYWTEELLKNLYKLRIVVELRGI